MSGRSRAATLERGGAVLAGVLASLVVVAVAVRLATVYLDDQPWVGFLLLLGGILLVVVAYDLGAPARRPEMWTIGAAVCLGLTAVYAVDAAVGLPHGAAASWWRPWVGAALLAEAVYVLAMTAWFVGARSVVRRRARWHASAARVRH